MTRGEHKGLRMLQVAALLVAMMAGLVGVVLTDVSLHDRHFMETASPEDLAVCVDDPPMDCDPRGWQRGLLVGIGLLLGATVALRYGLGLIRERRLPQSP